MNFASKLLADQLHNNKLLFKSKHFYNTAMDIEVGTDNQIIVIS